MLQQRKALEPGNVGFLVQMLSLPKRGDMSEVQCEELVVKNKRGMALFPINETCFQSC